MTTRCKCGETRGLHRVAIHDGEKLTAVRHACERDVAGVVSDAEANGRRATVVAVDRRRGHRFAPPKATLAKVPALYEVEHERDPLVRLHYFVGSWDWYVTELDPETWRAFGLVTSPACPHGEWGYIDLAELALVHAGATLNGHPFRQPVERDCHWTMVPISEVLS